MSITIHSDASVKDNKGRGAYVIIRKERKKSNNKVLKQHIHRTPIIRTSDSHHMETLTLYQALIHAYKLYPDEKNYDVFCDSNHAQEKIKKGLKRVIYGDSDANLMSVVRVMTNGLTKPLPMINIYNVKAHKTHTSTEAERYNFMCDILASIKSN